MQRILVSLVLVVALSAGFGVHSGPVTSACSSAQPNPDSGQTRRGSSRLANNFPGSDLGAKINAADKDLGNSAGEIVVNNGGIVSTQVVISPGHTLRFGPGTYRLMTELSWEGGFLLRSHTAVIGSGWDTIIVEPPRIGWIVFQSYESVRTKPYSAGTDSDISISNLQIKGANPAVDGGVRQTVSLGNCHRCQVQHVWLNGTGVIGVQAGGNALAGNFADSVEIRNNTFTEVASQAAAVVNGRNIVIDGNTFKASGRKRMEGMTPIDVEPNAPSDIAQHIEITNNTIDSRGSTFLHGNGILVQNGAGTRGFGPVLVKGNVIIGGDLVPNVSGNVATGIYVTAQVQDVTVINNTITRVAHAGIRLDGTTRSYVANNKLVSTGTGGIDAFEVMNTTDSTILNNVVTVDPNSPLGNIWIVETGNSRNNTYRGNTDERTLIAPIIRSRKP